MASSGEEDLGIGMNCGACHFEDLIELKDVAPWLYCEGSLRQTRFPLLLVSTSQEILCP